jgi:hypothetical protein
MKIGFMSLLAVEDTAQKSKIPAKDAKFHAGISDFAGERSQMGVYVGTSTE